MVNALWNWYTNMFSLKKDMMYASENLIRPNLAYNSLKQLLSISHLKRKRGPYCFIIMLCIELYWKKRLRKMEKWENNRVQSRVSRTVQGTGLVGRQEIIWYIRILDIIQAVLEAICIHIQTKMIILTKQQIHSYYLEILISFINILP